MEKIKTNLEPRELELILSSLLFSSSVNIISTTSEQYQEELVNLAVKLKKLKENVKLNDIEFVQEDNYEDRFSEIIFENFRENLEIVNFSKI